MPVFCSSINSKSSLSVKPAALSSAVVSPGLYMISVIASDSGVGMMNDASFSALQPTSSSVRALTTVFCSNETGDPS